MEFDKFLSNIRKKGKEINEETEPTEQLNLRPEWAEDKDDMYPRWKTQKGNEQPNARKIKSGCDVNGRDRMEELTNETGSIVLSPGFPARDKDIIASWESRIDGEGKSDNEDHSDEGDIKIENDRDDAKDDKENKDKKGMKELLQEGIITRGRSCQMEEVSLEVKGIN